MVNVLYSRDRAECRSSSLQPSWNQLLVNLRTFGEDTKKYLAKESAKDYYKPRAKESKLPTVLLGNITYIS